MAVSALHPEILALAVAAGSVSAVYSPTSADAPLIPAQYSSGNYHVIYTANTGCFGADGVSGRHNLDNMRTLSQTMPVDYINTNFQSEQIGPEWGAARTPRDSQGNDVPGTQIANVAQGGNSASTATQLGKALLAHYNLSAFSQNVVLVFVTDASDRQKDRIVRSFNTTFDTNFVGNVINAIQADETKQKQARTGAQRN